MTPKHAIPRAGPSGKAPTQEAGPVSNNSLEEALEQIRGLLQRGEVEGARARIKDLEREWPESRAVRHYMQVLAPPQVTIRRGQRGRRRDQERTWLREHAREYPGQWLAILKNRLIAADPDPTVVLTAVRQNPAARDALIHFQPGVDG